MSMGARRLKAEPPFELIEELWGRLFGDPHGAIALDVGVAAHRTQAGAGPADVAAQQREVGDLLDSLAAAPMLGYAHAVDQNDAVCLHVDVGCRTKVPAAQARLTLNAFPRRRAYICGEVFEAQRVAIDEVYVYRARRIISERRIVSFDHSFHYALESRRIAADADLDRCLTRSALT